MNAEEQALLDQINNTKISDLKYVVSFGKWRDRTIEFILAADPGWLVWAHDNVSRLELDNDLFIMADEAAIEQEFQRQMKNEVRCLRYYGDEEEMGNWHPGHPDNYGDR